MPDDLFVFRGGEPPDYGRDVALELVADGSWPTDVTIHGQLKSKARSKYNKDGSLSYAIELATLTYLSNHLPRSVWIIYLEDENEFLWAWVHEIRRHVENHVGLIEDLRQETVTYRFTQRLDRHAFETIYKDVSTRYRVLSEVNGFLDEATTAVQISYDPDTQKVTAVNAIHLVKQFGVQLANIGQFGLVRNWVSMVPQQAARLDMEFLAVSAYVAFHAGDYTTAWTDVRDIDDSQLSAVEWGPMVSFLRLILRFSQGFLTLNSYYAELCDLENISQGTPLGITLRLHRLRREFVQLHWAPEPGDDTRTDGILKSLSQTIESARKVSNHPALMNQCEVTLAEVYVQCSIREVTSLMLTARFLPRTIDLEARMRSVNEGLKKWTNRLVDMAFDDQLPLRYRARARLALVRGELMIMANAIAASGAALTPPEVRELERQLNWVRTTQQELTALHDVDDQLEAQLLVAELLNAIGRQSEAQMLAEEVRRNSERNSLRPTVEKAQTFLSGHTIFGIIDWINRRPSQDSLLRDMQGPMKNLYLQHLVRMGFKESQARSDLDWLIADAHERDSYCQHLHMVEAQAPRAQDSPPRRKYHCNVYDYYSLYPGHDREKLLREFKAQWCLGCNQRSPRSAKEG